MTIVEVQQMQKIKKKLIPIWSVLPKMNYLQP